MATPDPACIVVLLRCNEPGWLWIVNDNDVLIESHALPVEFIVLQENIFGRLRERVFGPVQRVVKALGNFEEIIAAGDDFPPGMHFQLIQQGDKPIEHFSYAAADGR